MKTQWRCPDYCGRIQDRPPKSRPRPLRLGTMKIYFYSSATAVVKDLRGYTLDCTILSKQCRIICMCMYRSICEYRRSICNRRGQWPCLTSQSQSRKHSSFWLPYCTPLLAPVFGPFSMSMDAKSYAMSYANPLRQALSCQCCQEFLPLFIVP